MEAIKKLCPTRLVKKWLHLKQRNAITASLSTEHAQRMQNHHALLKQIQTKIKATGPITCAEYMREVLLNPIGGYYIHKDAIGNTGDFITSPELSQMFGELIGVWCIHEWMKLGSPSPLQLVEFGPGRGSLMQDMIRVFSKFPDIQKSLSLHLVEISPKMQLLQETALCGSGCASEQLNVPGPYKRNTTLQGLPISWYLNLKDVPRGFSCFVAHEFLDALPVHIFKRSQKGWQEVLITLDQSANLQFALSGNLSPAAKVLIDPNEKRDHVEISAEAGIVVEDMVRRITEDGGFALIADYGHDGEKSDTFRSFRSHKLHDPLVDPGTADLTADVDFSYLKRIADNRVLTFGPIAQQTFLKNMGIDTRLKKLMSCNEGPLRDKILKGYELLTGPDMGQRFKFFSIYPLVMKNYVPDFASAGFS